LKELQILNKGVTLNEANNHQMHLQRRKKMLTEHTLCYKIFLKIKTSKKLKFILKNAIIDKTLTCTSETSTLTKRERKNLNIFERKVYRRILGTVYDNKKENWRILTLWRRATHIWVEPHR
jgi:hypothetical protein